MDKICHQISISDPIGIAHCIGYPKISVGCPVQEWDEPIMLWDAPFQNGINHQDAQFIDGISFGMSHSEMG